MSLTTLIEARDLVKDFGATRVIHGVSLDILRGETLGLVGESGSGKSTIARFLLWLIEHRRQYSLPQRRGIAARTYEFCN